MPSLRVPLLVLLICAASSSLCLASSQLQSQLVGVSRGREGFGPNPKMVFQTSRGGGQDKEKAMDTQAQEDRAAVVSVGETQDKDKETKKAVVRGGLSDRGGAMMFVHDPGFRGGRDVPSSSTLAATTGVANTATFPSHRRDALSSLAMASSSSLVDGDTDGTNTSDSDVVPPPNANDTGRAVFDATKKKKGGPLRVLFLSSDTGGGHRASAEALARHFQMYYPGTTYDLLDVWTMDGCYPYKTLVSSYKHLSAHPRQWKFLYHLSNTSPYMLAMDTHSALTCERKVRDRIASYNADVIVSVHPTMNNVPLKSVQKLRKSLHKEIPFFTVVTDFGSGHATWFKNGVDKCFVASDRIRRLAKRRGRVPDRDLVQSGLPIRHDFAVHAAAMGMDRTSPKGRHYQRKVRKTLEIPDEQKMILVMGGGEGVGSLSSYVEALYTTCHENGQNVTIAVVCGRNAELRSDLQNKDWDKVLTKNRRIKKRRHLHRLGLGWLVPSRRIRRSLRRAAEAAAQRQLHKQTTHTHGNVNGNVDVLPLGFVSNMAAYMVAADILVTKAGPGTIAEAAALGLPVLLTSFLPGQEAGNVDVVLDGGFGDFNDQPWGIADEVSGWLQNKRLLDHMSQRAMKIGVPDAASDIVIEIGETTHRLMERNRQQQQQH